MTRSLNRAEHDVHEAVAGRPSDPTAVAVGGAVLEAVGIEKAYRRGIWPARHSSPVLRGADLTLCPGEVVGLVGENGSGKSTLMKILVGALPADASTVTVAGRLGYCPQEPAGTPRWVKILGVVVLLLVLLVAVLHLIGNGPSPGSHLGSAVATLPWP